MYKSQMSEVLTDFALTLVADVPDTRILDHLVERIVEILPITSAGVTLIGPTSDPHYVAASDESALRFEKLQTELGEGPCLVAYRSGSPVLVPDLHLDERFPRFAAAAEGAGLHAVFAFPLFHHSGRFGALDLYRSSPGPLPEQAVEAAGTLANVAAVYLINAQARDDAANHAEYVNRMVNHDELTGLPNMRLLSERIEHANQRVQRSHAPAAMLFIDLDLIVQRIRLSFERPFRLGDVQVSITASIGVAFVEGGGQVTQALVTLADKAMYAERRRLPGSRTDLA